MHASLTLGRVRGIEIGLNWSWFGIFALIIWSLAASVFPSSNPHLGSGAYIAMAVVGAAFFFGSIVLHELGHAVVAQREGMEIGGITLWVFGGVARFKGSFPSARAELRIALAGPIVSVALGAAFTAAASFLPLPAGVDGVVGWLGGINLLLVLFNMLPALPLDGGRVLRAILWARSGDFGRATRSAGTLAMAMGQVLVFLGIALVLLTGLIGGLWLALIGWFVRSAARAETAYGAMVDALTGLRARDAMVSNPLSVPATASLRDFLDGTFARTQYASYPVVDAYAAVIGVIAAGDAEDVPPAARDTVTVGDRMVPLAKMLVVDEEMDLADATTELLQTSLGRALVGQDGAIVGLLSLTDVQEVVERRTRSAVAMRR